MGLELPAFEKRMEIRHDHLAELSTLGFALLGAIGFWPADGQTSHPSSEDPVRYDGTPVGRSLGVGFKSYICKNVKKLSEEE